MVVQFLFVIPANAGIQSIITTINETTEEENRVVSAKGFYLVVNSQA